MPIFNNYSRNAVEDVFPFLTTYFPQKRWLGKENHYLEDCIERIQADISASPAKLNQATNTGRNFHIAQYVAASVPLHCLDGWTLLGEALSCNALGDTNGAKHFGYYAELRAVMALLGAEGIGIFGKYHFTLAEVAGRVKPSVSYIDTGVAPNRGAFGTHKGVRKGLEEWSQSSASGDLLAEIIRPEGLTLKQWFEEFTRSYTHPWINIGQQWLNQWGYDFTVLENDKLAREDASYRPFFNNKNNRPDLQAGIRLLEDIWNQSESGGSNHSFGVDIYLLRRSLHSYKITAGINSVDFRKNLKRTITQLGFIGAKNKALYDFLKKVPSPKNDPMVLTEADKEEKITNHRYHLQLLSRATLLLRIATGASNRLMQKSGVSKTHIEFWWKTIGESRGLWDASAADPLVDMWTDVQDALTKIKTSASPSSYAQWRINFPDVILALSGCERIGLSRICL